MTGQGAGPVAWGLFRRNPDQATRIEDLQRSAAADEDLRRMLRDAWDAGYHAGIDLATGGDCLDNPFYAEYVDPLGDEAAS